MLVFVLLLALLSICVFELGYTHNVYSGLCEDAISLDTVIDEINKSTQDNKDKTVHTAATIRIVDNILYNWQLHKRWLMSFIHHNILLELDKSIIRLHTLVYIDMYEDCKVECKSVINLLNELRAYNKFSIQNIC